jgi:predicted RNase H-like HicB family nuclease
MTVRYLIIFEKSATGYSAYAPDLDGCVATGPTLAKTREMMEGALKMHLSAMVIDGDLIPEPTTEGDYLTTAV